MEQGETLRGIADAVGALLAGQAVLTETVGRHEEILARLAAGQDALQEGHAEILRRLASGG